MSGDAAPVKRKRRHSKKRFREPASEEPVSTPPEQGEEGTVPSSSTGPSDPGPNPASKVPVGDSETPPTGSVSTEEDSFTPVDTSELDRLAATERIARETAQNVAVIAKALDAQINQANQDRAILLDVREAVKNLLDGLAKAKIEAQAQASGQAVQSPGTEAQVAQQVPSDPKLAQADAALSLMERARGLVGGLFGGESTSAPSDLATQLLQGVVQAQVKRMTSEAGLTDVVTEAIRANLKKQVAPVITGIFE